MVFWIRPPTIVSVLMLAPVLTIPPEPVCEIVAIEASIPGYRWIGVFASCTLPADVKMPSTCPVLLAGMSWSIVDDGTGHGHRFGLVEDVSRDR